MSTRWRKHWWQFWRPKLNITWPTNGVVTFVVGEGDTPEPQKP